MKAISTIIIAAATALALISCEDKKGNGKLDPSAKVYINAAQMPQAAPSKANSGHFTPLEIVKRAAAIHPKQWVMTVGDWNRDTVNQRFVVGSEWVISSWGDLTEAMLTARDMVFEFRNYDGEITDTVAYIPNAAMEKAESDIRKAFAAENYTECYRLLQEAFVFIPTTGAEYRELQARGEN